MSNELVVFAWGVSLCATAAVSLAFACYWRRSHDRLFLLFSLAFALLGVERVAALMVRQSSEAASPALFAIRLVAFGIIIAAVVGKNRESRPAR